jgi:hypothetical protein
MWPSAARKYGMARLLRRAVGLVAAYAIALQAVLSGILTAEHAIADPLSIICASDDSDDPGGLPQHEGHDCGPCILSCGANPALTPSSTVLPLAPVSATPRHTSSFEALPSTSRHHPQAARAPPASV